MLQSQRTQYVTTQHNTRTQHLVHLATPKRTMPAGWILDKIADEKLSGGYKTTTCPKHFIKLSVSGECIECD